MLLAEALAARKDTITQIEDLRARLAAAVLRYEDQDPAWQAGERVHLARVTTGSLTENGVPILGCLDGRDSRSLLG